MSAVKIQKNIFLSVYEPKGMNLYIDSYLNVERKQSNVFSNNQNLMASTQTSVLFIVKTHIFPNFAQCGSVSLFDSLVEGIQTDAAIKNK